MRQCKVDQIIRIYSAKVKRNINKHKPTIEFVHSEILEIIDDEASLFLENWSKK